MSDTTQTVQSGAAAEPGPTSLCACGHTFFMHSNNKGAEECMVFPCLTFRPATPVGDVTDADRLRQMAVKLWDILDAIDTMSDAAKSDDKAYRAAVEKLQARRREVMASDGYELFEVRPCAFCTQTPCPCEFRHDVCSGCLLCLGCFGCDCDDSHPKGCGCRECLLVARIDRRAE